MLKAKLIGQAISPGLLLHQRQQSASTSTNTSKRSRHIAPDGSEEEIFYFNTTVIWSRGVEIYRQWTFDSQAEDEVTWAGFVWFPSTLTSSTVDALGTTDSTFGPFHTSRHNSWSSPPQSSSSAHKIVRTTMICLKSRAIVYYPSGESHTVHLPFLIDKAYALPQEMGGVIVQRRLEQSEKRDLEGKKSVLRGMNQMSMLDELGMEKDSLPRLYTLSNPFEEIKQVVEGSVNNGRLVDEEVIDYSMDVLYVSETPYSFVVVYDQQQQEIIFYIRHNIPLIDTPPARHQRPHELLAQAPPRPSLHRTGSTFSTTGDRRVSTINAEAMDRTRRGPRVSRGGIVENVQGVAGAGELQAVLDPPSLPPVPVGSRIKGKARASVADRRDSSLFVDSDRPALFGAGEWDLRETTMVMGLDREETRRSEVVLERIWSWKLPAPSASINVFATENLSPDMLHLNVHLGSTLYVFAARRTTEWTIDPPVSVACDAAIPVLSTRPGVYDAMILVEGSLHLVTSSSRTIPIGLPFLDELPRHLAASLTMDHKGDHRIVGISDSVDSRFTIIFDDGDSVQVSVDFRLQDRLVRQCFEAIAALLPADEVFELKRAIIVNASYSWDDFCRTLSSLLGIPFSTIVPPSSALSAATCSKDGTARRLVARLQKRVERGPVEANPILTSMAATSVLLALHLVGQDCRLSQKRRADLELVADVVKHISAATGRKDWLDYWQRLSPGNLLSSSGMPVRQIDTSLLDRYESPPDIVAYLSRRLVTPLKPFPTCQSIDPHISEMGLTTPCAATQLLTSIYDRLGVASDDAPALASLRKRTDETIRFMTTSKLGSEYLDDLPAGIAMPILEMLRVAHADPSKHWTDEMYDLIGRTDLAAQARGGLLAKRDRSKMLDADIPTIGAISAKSGHKHQLHDVPHVRFGSDRRLAEVERIMQTTRTRTILARDSSNHSDTDAAYQQSLVNTIAIRTLSILVGQGIFEYSTRTANITDSFDIPLIELTVKVVPGNQTLPAQISSENADWPCFHNGVATALSISADRKGIDSSWIVLNRPSALNPEHGGFLLGLGLSGHLRHLATYHAFPYLEPRHDYTSVGLLLGLAASFAGSQDLLLTKVLSLHTHALLPLGSMELNASATVQSTSLVGLGLLYVGTRNLRMAEVALGEVGRKIMPGVDGFADYAEGYSFSASMAFGLIMLGRGGHISSEVDRRIVAKLTRCIIGTPRVMEKTASIDTTITAPGATLALGLMYLKSNRSDIANILEIPTTAFALESVRPEILLLRVFARALIMWDTVAPSMGWIESQLPSFINHQNHKKISQMELNVELAYINIVAGACFAIGLKYAGTAGEVAHNSLMKIYNTLNKAASMQSMSYEGSIRRTAARQGLNVVTLALTAVMSGTGELGILQRLRVSHSQEGAGVNYGSHMAVHMAIGLLFLGRGYYTLGSSNLAIAVLAISFFPRFAPTPGDNRAYPQAFRHLWAMAVEPRCLVARDVDTRETVYLPVKVKLREAGQERFQSLISPTLVAPFDSLMSIELDTPRYWPITYDLSNPRDRQALIKTRTIYVKRKAGYLDYNQDPKGNRSMFIRTGTMTGLDLNYDLISPAAPPTIGSDEVLELVEAHSGDPALVSLAKYFKGQGFERAVRIILLECISLDKQRMIPIYLSLLLTTDSARLETVRQLGFIKKYYTVFDRHYALPSARERQTPWIRATFVAALLRRLTSVDVDAKVLKGYWVDGVWQADHEALAVYLAKNNVPALPLLEALAGRVKKRGENAALRVRDAAGAYSSMLEGQWDLEPGRVNEGSGWKASSIEEAVKSWNNASS